MRVLLQRVKEASVRVEGKRVSEIKKGILMFVNIGKNDTDDDIDYIARKVSNMRIFEDEQGKMNLSVKQVNGSILSVSQFTLYADTRKGNRPYFGESAGPDDAYKKWKMLNERIRGEGIVVEEGVFGAHMEVYLINDGPVTIWLESE